MYKRRPDSHRALRAVQYVYVVFCMCRTHLLRRSVYVQLPSPI